MEQKTREHRRGFSLLELLIVLAVTALLLALLMPSFHHMRESARQVACASNLRQIGMGISSYADDRLAGAGHLPHSRLARAPNGQKDMMVLVLVDGSSRGWEGLGHLLASKHLSAAEIFYCPSHHGDHPFPRYEAEWSTAPRSARTIFANYHYRGLDPDPERPRPIDTTPVDTLRKKKRATWGLNHFPIVADGMRTRRDYNHIVGNNILNLDLTVTWYDDSSHRVYNSLPDTELGFWRTNPWVRLERRVK